MSQRTGISVAVESLVKTFKGSIRALDGVSFEISTGTVLGLLGPNGAGKTTAVRVLTTLLRPDSGKACVADVDVLTNPRDARKVIGLAGQYAAVDEALTGSENLLLVGTLNHMSRADRREQAKALLEQFGLAEAADRPLKTYSGGMRRRLDLAAALVGRPPVLFLDEPTSGLNPCSRIDLWAVIADLVADGTTVPLTTQYLEEADRLANQIYVVDHGHVIAQGSAGELKATLGGAVDEVVLSDDRAAAAAAHAVGLIIIVVVGFAVGFRPHSVPGLILGLLVLLAFALSTCFIFALVGLYASSVQTVNAATFPVVFPLTFASSAFVPTSTMPSWLRTHCLPRQPARPDRNGTPGDTAGVRATARQQALVHRGDPSGAWRGRPGAHLDAFCCEHRWPQWAADDSAGGHSRGGSSPTGWRMALGHRSAEHPRITRLAWPPLQPVFAGWHAGGRAEVSLAPQTRAKDRHHDRRGHGGKAE